MTRLRIWLSRLRGFLGRGHRDVEMDEEIQTHLALLTEEHIARGLPPDEARAAARRSFGGVEQVKEAYRDQRGLPQLETLLQDLRFSFRSLLRDRWVSVAAISTLGLGLGMNVTVFSVVNAVLLHPFPFGDQDRLVIVWEQDVTRDGYLREVSYPNFQDWRRRSESFDEMAAMGSTAWGRVRFAGEDEPFSGTHRAVSYSFFDTLGVKAALGRTFLPDDETAGSPPVMVVSHRFWRTKLGSDPAVVGKSVARIDDGPISLIGVMPRAFDYPLGTDVWTPVGTNLARVSERNDFTSVQERNLGVLFVIGRLKLDVTIEEASSELTGIVRLLRKEHSGEANPQRGVRVLPLVDELLGKSRPALLGLWGAVGLVWLLVNTNVAALFLVRTWSRAREYSIRLALGAGRLRIVRQMLTEIGLVTLLGAGLGWVLAKVGIHLLPYLSALDVPRLENVTLDSTTLRFFAVTMVATMILVSIAPIMLFASAGSKTGRGATDSRRSASVRRWLVVAQIAVSLVLLVGAGLMARSFLNLRDADLGFESEHVLTFRVALPKRSYPNGPSRRALYRELLGNLESLPGVIAAAGINNRPFLHGQVGDDRTYFVEGQVPEEHEQNPRANGMVVSTNYFRAMNIEVIRGRPFTERDDERAEPVVVISESLARQAWPAQNPIGKKLCCGRAANGEELWLTAVGVVENARYRDMYAPRLDIYEHYLQGFSNLPNFVVRTRSDPLLHAGAIRQQLITIEPRLSMEGITTMDAVMDRVFAPWRITSTAFGLFAVFAVALAGLGLFGILAFDVHRRTREIGIRVAFGATSGRIARLVATQAIGMVVIGALLGSAGGILLTRVLRNLLYGATATHPTTYVAAAAVLFLVSSLATYFPARQATKADPWISLRHE